MNSSLDKDIEAWEGEGGATPVQPVVRATSMIGTPNQVEWAERIKRQVDDEFDRVAQSFRSVASTQSDAARADTEAIIAILEEKRAEVMRREQAGYFIRYWQELGGKVRQMIFEDPRYQAIKSNRSRRKGEAKDIMNIRPLYDRILVKRLEEQESTLHGIVIPDSAKEKPQEGEVLAVGHGKRLESGKLVALDVKVGDHILFGKYSGNETKLDGTEFIFMREDDVLGILESGPKARNKNT